jgi:hypothetical protein
LEDEVPSSLQVLEQLELSVADDVAMEGGVALFKDDAALRTMDGPDHGAKRLEIGLRDRVKRALHLASEMFLQAKRGAHPAPFLGLLAATIRSMVVP